MTLHTYDEWEKVLFIEDTELTSGSVPRTTRQLKELWEIYKAHHPACKIASPRYTEFTGDKK